MFEGNPDPPGAPTFRPQHQPRLSDLKMIHARAAAAQRRAMEGGDADEGDGFGGPGMSDDLMPDGWWARLTTPADAVTGLYSHVEVQDDGTGSDWTPCNAPARGVGNAMEINKSIDIVVPGPPPALTGNLVAGGSLTPGQIYYYVVTAEWEDAASNTYQSELSPEVFLAPSGGNLSVDLTWTAPALADGYTLTHYQVWRGTSSGGENLLIGTTATSVETFTDTGITGTSESPILGGTAGPIVWMSPLAVQGFYKFFYPAPPTLPAFVKPTTATPSTVRLPFVGTGTADTISAYAAKLESWSDRTGTWSDGATVWWFGANGETPTANKRYLCKLIGVAEDGTQIWSVHIPPAPTPDFGSGHKGGNSAIGTSFADVLSVTVANTGLYQITGFVACEGEFTGTLSATSCAGALIAQNGSPVAMPVVPVLSPQQNSGSPFIDGGSLSAVLPTSAGDAISIQVQMMNGSLTGWTLANVLGGTNSHLGTWLTYTQVG